MGRNPSAVSLRLAAAALAAVMLSGIGLSGCRNAAGDTSAVKTAEGAGSSFFEENTPFVVTPLPTAGPTEKPTVEPTEVPTQAPDVFVSSAKELRAALESDAAIIGLAADVKIDAAEKDDGAISADLTVSRPVTVRLCGFTLEITGDLLIDTYETGSVSFTEGTLKAADVRAQAPGIELVIDAYESPAEGGSAPDADSYKLWLASYNGRKNKDGIFHLKSETELADFIDPGTLPRPADENTPETAVQTVSIDYAAERDSFPYIDAPYTDLYWEGESAYTGSEAAMYLNVHAFNGALSASYGLGGTGDVKLAGIDFRASTGLQNMLPWEIKGNTIRLQLPLHISANVENRGALEIVPDGDGTVTVNPDAMNEDGTYVLTRLHRLTITDSAGRTRTYSVEISRKFGEIPVVFIETEGGAQVESTEEYIRCTVYVTNTIGSGFPSVPVTSASIRGRGNSTWKWDKKPYRIKFDSGVSLFGLHKAKDWVLLANYADKSLIRNTVAFDMARTLSFSFVPHQYPVDVYFNGEYVGVYTVGEQIEVNQERVDIDESYEETDTGYLMEVCGSEEDDVRGVDYFHAGYLRFVKIKSPDTEFLSREQFAFISGYVQSADDAVRARSGYDEFVNVQSLIDWIIMCELTCNIDTAFRRSCFITKPKGGKLEFGPLWDFDLAFGNFSRDGGNYTSWACTGREYVGENWFCELILDPEFCRQFKTRWFEKRDELLDAAFKSIDVNGTRLAYSQEENFEVWQIWDLRAGFQPKSMVSVNTFELQLDFLRTWLTDRAAWLDGAISALYSETEADSN